MHMTKRELIRKKFVLFRWEILLRKYVSRHLPALSEGEIASLTTAMRQLVVGSQGGAEALAIFHQLIYDEWASGSLVTPLARIKVDEKNCFAMIEWASCLHPKHAAVAGWKHRALSHVDQDGVPPLLADRGAEQGDVGGLLECSLALGLVAAEAYLHVAHQQAARTLPWIGTDDPVTFSVIQYWYNP